MALLTLHVMTEMHFSLQNSLKNIMHGLIKKVCDVLTFSLDKIFILFGSKLSRLVVGIPMNANCAALVAEFILVLQ